MIDLAAQDDLELVSTSEEGPVADLVIPSDPGGFPLILRQEAELMREGFIPADVFKFEFIPHGRAGSVFVFFEEDDLIHLNVTQWTAIHDGGLRRLARG